MDIRAYAKRMSELACRPAEGDTLISLWRRIRLSKKKNWNFWRGLLSALKEETLAILRTSLKTTCLEASVLGLWLTHVFIYAATYICEAVEIEPLRTEFSRGPPKLFIPIPKIETGGCARSDSLVRSLIFWRAVPSML